jgi:cyclic 2,3-diphosphoglycerate synthase
VIDGEHYVPVVREALAELPYEFVAALHAGGTEKLRGGEDYGLPLATSLDEAVRLYAPAVVVDLSDEPVLGPRERFRLASQVLAAGLPYVGADFRFEPPVFEPFPLPSLSVFGTGKRVGKTAVIGHVARLFARDRDVLVVAMGRGGPPEPELIDAPPTVQDLLSRSRAGRHAASDHLETAALAGVPTIGCRRAGGGLAGATFVSNLQAGARLAAKLAPDLVIFDGSGAAVPPVATDARVLVAHDLEQGLNLYRALIADLVLTMSEDVAAQATAVGRRALRFDLRLEPAERLAGRRTALFATGPTHHDHLAEIVSVSRNLADRDLLRADLAATEAEVFLVELKAAAIDIVAEAAAERGIPLVLARNDVVAPGLDEALLELAG